MNEASRYLQSLAREVAAALAVHTEPQAILLTGSAATGESDQYSDVDLIAYYDALPAEDAVQRAREAVGGSGAHPIGAPRGQGADGDEPENGGFAEQFEVRGVQVQVGYSTVRHWERELDKVLVEHDPDPLLQKAIGGLLEGLPLHGQDVIAQWQARAAAYPDALGLAMVERHLHFFPLWRVGEHLATRDTTVWVHQALAEAALNLLGVLAGINRRYYSTFQFKRMHAFAATLDVAPADLADRLERLFSSGTLAAAEDLEALVAETVALVEIQLPGVDVAHVRRHLGLRQRPWHPTSPAPG